MAETPGLAKALTQRQLTMIAMGGVIGAGLFVGSGVVINSTGPAVVITYAVTGLMIIMVMRMLAEMAVANPSTGSFSEYSRLAMGNWAGFSVAWLYWWNWVVTVGAEAIAGATIIKFWLDVPLWSSSLILMVLLTATNLFSVASFGEFEFWFAGIKVAAIAVFLFLGSLYVLGLWPHKRMDFSNLTNHGFMPNGVTSLIVAVVTVIFSMVGAEIATIAAAESQDPERAVSKAANSVIVRIATFFVGSIFLLVTILPWKADGTKAGPFVAAFAQMGIPYANDVMNAVALTAVLSCLNSGLYTSSRMLFVLAARREAPQRLVRVTGRGVPAVAILVCSLVGFLCVIGAVVAPNTIFVFLLNSVGAIYLVVYLMITVSQIVLRYRTPNDQLRVKMWLFPWLSIAIAVAIFGVLVVMALNASTRTSMLTSMAVTVVVVGLYFLNKRFVQSRPVVVDAVPAGAPHRVLVMANHTIESEQLLEELRRLRVDRDTEFHVVVPKNPIDTGVAAAHGPIDIQQATQAAASARVDSLVQALLAEGARVSGAVGDYRPLRALRDAVNEFRPDQIVISTLPPTESTWQRFDVVDRARAEHGLPVTHVFASSVRTATPDSDA